MILSCPRLKAFFYTCGEAQVEVIEITEPDERARRLGLDSARVEHIAIEVDNLTSTVKALEALGVKTQTAQSVQIGTDLSYMTVAESTDGVVYQLRLSQLCEKDPTRQARPSDRQWCG